MDKAERHALDDAGRIIGLLAEPERLRVISALVLGASTVEDVVAMTPLSGREVERSLARLNAGGLIEHLRGSGFRVRVESLKVVAAALAQARADDDPVDAPPELARVLKAFFKHGRLTSIPTQRGKRLIVLDHISQMFEPGRRYPEASVNEMLSRFHDDVAALRRWLIDDGFMEREGGIYWRAGGTFAID